MKISNFNKSIGNNVILLLNYDDIDLYDKVFISKVFNFTKTPKDLELKSNVIIGGTGFFDDGGVNLDDNIEHFMPDYHLYDDFIKSELERGVKRSKFTDYLDYSIGFATRGCFRKCAFCVNKKYDKAFKHSPVNEFLDETKKAMYLWDDNFLAYSGWEKVLDEIEKVNKPFQFRQGLDIRLLTERSAERFSKTKYKGDFIFAFDHLKDREVIEKNLELWRRYSSKSTKLYVLCAYESQDGKDIESAFKRIEILMKYKCLPYIMRYESYKDSEYRGMYINLARWCNQPGLFKKKSFREFCLVNQNPKSTKVCASIRYMNKFENDYPDIAKKYYDIKWEQYN